MKKRTVLLTLTILIAALLMCLTTALGASASLSVSGGGTYNVGDTVKITFTVSGTNIAGGQARITYDNSALQYTGGSGASLPTSAAGVVQAQYSDGYAHSSMSVSLTFKALKAGSSSVSVEAYDVIDIEYKEMSGSTKSVAVTVKNPSQAASGNANLSSLRVSAGSLSPSFSPNTTSYTVNVANSVTTCTMTATKADPNATLSVSGSASLSVGKNTRSITVTAQNGTTKTYTITIYRAAADSDNDADEDEDKDKDDENERPQQLEVAVGEKEYVVVENYADIEIPQGLAVTVAKLGEYDIPALADKDLKYTLVLLYDEETGDNAWFFYDQEKSEFSASVPMSTDELIDFLAAASSERAEKVEAQEGITTNTILFIALGVTGAALLAVIIALQVKIIRKGK